MFDSFFLSRGGEQSLQQVNYCNKSVQCTDPPLVILGALVMTIINTGDDENRFIHSGEESALVSPTWIYPLLPWGFWS